MLSPDLVKALPTELLNPLKGVLADSLNTVFFVSGCILVVGFFVSFFMGNARIIKRPHMPVFQEAGIEILTEEANLSSDTEPDLIDGK